MTEQNRLINNISEITESELTLPNLQCLNHSGRSYNVTTSQDYRKKYAYRSGIITPIGDIEESVWQELIRKLVKNRGEEVLFNNLKEWLSEHCAWCKTNKAVENEALELYSISIFDNKFWVDYVAFNGTYRPNLLDDPDLAVVTFNCCGKEGKTTKETIRSYGGEIQAPCPYCFKHSTFVD